MLIEKVKQGTRCSGRCRRARPAPAPCGGMELPPLPCNLSLHAASAQRPFVIMRRSAGALVVSQRACFLLPELSQGPPASSPAHLHPLPLAKPPCSAGGLAWRLASRALGQPAGQGAAACVAGKVAARAVAAVDAATSAASHLLRSSGSSIVPRGTVAYSSLAASALAPAAAGAPRTLLLPAASAPLRRSGLAAALASPGELILPSRAALPQLLQTAGLRQSAVWEAKRRRKRSGQDGYDNDEAESTALTCTDAAQQPLPVEDEAAREEREFQRRLDGLRQEGYDVHVVEQEEQQWQPGQPVRRVVHRRVQISGNSSWTAPPFLRRMAVWTGILSSIGLFFKFVPADIAAPVGTVLFLALWLASMG